MTYVKLIKDTDDIYLLNDASNIKMTVLGLFFSIDIEGSCEDSFREWAVESTDGDLMTGNLTLLEKEMNDIFFSDLYSEESIPTKLSMSTAQFLQLYDEWYKKVLKLRPATVIIKQEYRHFFIETSND